MIVILQNAWLLSEIYFKNKTSKNIHWAKFTGALMKFYLLYLLLLKLNWKKLVPCSKHGCINRKQRYYGLEYLPF